MDRPADIPAENNRPKAPPRDPSCPYCMLGWTRIHIDYLYHDDNEEYKPCTMKDLVHLVPLDDPSAHVKGKR